MWWVVKPAMVVGLLWYWAQKQRTQVDVLSVTTANCTDGAGNVIPCQQGTWGEDPDPLGLLNQQYNAALDAASSSSSTTVQRVSTTSPTYSVVRRPPATIGGGLH